MKVHCSKQMQSCVCTCCAARDMLPSSHPAASSIHSSSSFSSSSLESVSSWGWSNLCTYRIASHRNCCCALVSIRKHSRYRSWCMRPPHATLGLANPSSPPFICNSIESQGMHCAPACIEMLEVSLWIIWVCVDLHWNPECILQLELNTYRTPLQMLLADCADIGWFGMFH